MCRQQLLLYTSPASAAGLLLTISTAIVSQGRQENIEAAQREVQSNITALHKQIADLLERLSAVTYKEGKAQAELARERASKIRLKEQHALDLHTMQQKFDELQETVSNKAAAITGGREWYSKPARKR